jgi:ML domain
MCGKICHVYTLMLRFFIAVVAICLADARRYWRHSPFAAPNAVMIADQTNWTGGEVCSSAGALATNFVVSVSNDTPAQGTNVSTTFDFDLDTPIVGGTAYYSATLNGLGPFTSQAPLCDETAKTGDPCPLAVGHHHQVSTTTNTVSGKVVTTITWYDQVGATILCARITTKST